MNDLIRQLYMTQNISPSEKICLLIKLHEFVGPICETSDKFLTKNIKKSNKEIYFIIHDVGAYGMVLSSNYNLRPKPAEVLIKGIKKYYY